MDKWFEDYRDPKEFVVGGLTRWCVFLRDDSDGPDSLWLDGDGAPMLWEDQLTALQASSVPRDEVDSTCYDLDLAMEGFDRLIRSDPNVMLDAWNFIDDFLQSSSHPLGFGGKVESKSYEKLFWATNPPSLTPSGEHYVPTWRRRELRKMYQVLSRGRKRVLDIVRATPVQSADCSVSQSR